MSARKKFFDVLAADAELNALGITTASLFPNFAPDSPAADLMRFMVLRWGVAEAPPGRDTTAQPVAVSIWAYDRDKDFGNILAMLRRARAVLAGLVGARTSDVGAVIGVDLAFSSEDLFDETYDAIVRSETYRVVVSGE